MYLIMTWMRLECIMKVSHPAGALWLGRAGPVVIKQKKWSTQDNICVMTCYYQSQPGVRGYRQRLHAFWKEKGLFQVGEQRLCYQVWMIQKKGWLSQLQLEEIRRLAERGERNVEAQQVKQNWTGTEPIQQVTEQHITQNEENTGRGEEIQNYWSITTILTQ